MPCSGDSEQPCGAGNRITVYTSDLMAPAVPGWKYSGCFADSAAAPVLTGDDYSSTTNMTWENCIEFCVDGNFRYAGIGDGSDCCMYPIKIHVDPRRS